MQALKMGCLEGWEALKMRCLESREACKVWERVVGGSGECRLYHVVLLLGSHNFWDLP